ncbi:MAG: translation elongation factor EF-P, partial [Pirellulales bacterium]
RCSPFIGRDVKPSARGAATYYKYRARNLLTRQKVDITLKGGDSLDEADFQKRAARFMYSDGTHLHFLDDVDFNQYSLPAGDVEEEARYLTPELEGVQALIYNEQCVGVQIPSTVALRIAQCDPQVKGNSATGRTKPATLETGTVIQVPEYLAEGEVIKVDTRTGEFLSRA